MDDLLSSPRLWIVATPLGNIRDLSPRAREILEQVDLVLCEDTRRCERLCLACGIRVKKMMSFHEHNEQERLSWVLDMLQKKADIALVSDAGTPLVSDPGYRLVRQCRKMGLACSPVPGPSAPVCALSAAGLPPIPYAFLGFLPRERGAKEKVFAPFVSLSMTLVFFERADRLKESLDCAYAVLGAREIAICRELTKSHEEFILGHLGAAFAYDAVLGEVTVVVGAGEKPEKSERAAFEDEIVEHLERGENTRLVLRNIRKSAPGWTSSELYSVIEEIKQTRCKK